MLSKQESVTGKYNSYRFLGIVYMQDQKTTYA